MITRELRPKSNVPLQVVDFSPVSTSLHDFAPHFSVRRVWFLAGCEDLTGIILGRSLHPISREAERHELTRMGGGEIGNILPKAGPLGIGPIVGLSDLIPLGLAGSHQAQVVDFQPKRRKKSDSVALCRIRNGGKLLGRDAQADPRDAGATQSFGSMDASG
jgi:hypothetical protein